MPTYKATLTVELTIDAPNEHTARTTATKVLSLPHDAPSLTVDRWTCRMQAPRPLDTRLIAHLPNLPKLQLAGKLMSLSDVELAILQFCASPQQPSLVFRHVLSAQACQMTDIARAITTLKNAGYLQVAQHNVELDTFPTFGDVDARANFTVLAKRESR